MKLTKFNCGNYKNHRAKETDKLITCISQNSNPNGEKLLEFMELNHLTGLNQANEKQLLAYINKYMSEENTMQR